MLKCLQIMYAAKYYELRYMFLKIAPVEVRACA